GYLLGQRQFSRDRPEAHHDHVADQHQPADHAVPVLRPDVRVVQQHVVVLQTDERDAQLRAGSSRGRCGVALLHRNADHVEGPGASWQPVPADGERGILAGPIGQADQPEALGDQPAAPAHRDAPAEVAGLRVLDVEGSQVLLGGRRLAVQVDDEHPLAGTGQDPADVDHGAGATGAAGWGDHRDDLRVRGLWVSVHLVTNLVSQTLPWMRGPDPYRRALSKPL